MPENSFPQTGPGGHVYANAVISCRGGFLVKIKHHEQTKSLPAAKWTPAQRTALGIIPEMVVRESAREKARQKTAGEKLAGMQKQKEPFEQEPVRPENIPYGSTAIPRTPPLPTPPGLIPADTVKSRNNPVK